MDNFSAHKMEHKRVRELTFRRGGGGGGVWGFQCDNVVCLYLPPNVTSVIQPLDQGIIAAFKAHYRRQHVAFNLSELDNGTKQKDIRVNMLQVLQWMREARRYVECEPIANCWVKSGILPPLYENELRGVANRKSLRGQAKFTHDLTQLTAEFTKVQISDIPTAEDLLTMPFETVQDKPSNNVSQGEQGMQTEKQTTEHIETTKDDDEEDDCNNELMDIPLTTAKEYATALHHFVVNNIDQPHMLEFEEISLKLSRAINQMVTSRTKKQTEISSVFPTVTEMN